MSDEKQKLAESAIIRARSGLMFLEDCLRHRHGGTDFGYSRSWYTLLSINFELILIALLVLENPNEKKSEIVKEITKIKPSHDFEKLSKKIPSRTFLDVGIKSIKKDGSTGFTKYIVEIMNGNKIIVEDLVDVRYDFKKESKRKIDSNEVNRIKSEVENLLVISQAIHEKISL